MYALLTQCLAGLNNRGAIALQYWTDVSHFYNLVARYKPRLWWGRICMLFDVCASSWPATP